MDPSEPALKPQWLKSQNTNLSSNGISNPNSNAVSCRNRLTSIFSEKDSKLSKSKAYSSFGTRSNRNRNRSRKQEKDSDSFEKDSNSNSVLDRFDSLLSIPSEKDKLRRSRSFTSTLSTDNNNNIKLPEKNNKINSQNGFLSKKDFPLLKTNGVLETGKRVSSPMERIQFAQNGGEWNSVLAEVPFTASPAGSNGSNGLSKKEAVTGLNMAKAVAQAPSQDHSATQVTIDPQKIEELTIKQCKQLIPVTPTIPKNLVASSTEKLKAKGLRSLAPITVSKPASQLGTFQVLNRDKNGTVSPSFSSSASGTFSKPSNPNPNPNPITPTNNIKGKNGVSKQAKARLEFFNFLRSKAASDNPSSLSENGSDDRQSDGKLGNGNDEVADKWDPQSDEEMCLDPEEEAFLRSLGWDANAEVDALTKEEIDAFNSKYKEKMQFSMVSQQKILSMS